MKKLIFLFFFLLPLVDSFKFDHNLLSALSDRQATRYVNKGVVPKNNTLAYVVKLFQEEKTEFEQVRFESCEEFNDFFNFFIMLKYPGLTSFGFCFNNLLVEDGLTMMNSITYCDTEKNLELEQNFLVYNQDLFNYTKPFLRGYEEYLVDKLLLPTFDQGLTCNFIDKIPKQYIDYVNAFFNHTNFV